MPQDTRTGWLDALNPGDRVIVRSRAASGVTDRFGTITKVTVTGWMDVLEDGYQTPLRFTSSGGLVKSKLLWVRKNLEECTAEAQAGVRPATED